MASHTPDTSKANECDLKGYTSNLSLSEQMEILLLSVAKFVKSNTTCVALCMTRCCAEDTRLDSACTESIIIHLKVMA